MASTNVTAIKSLSKVVIELSAERAAELRDSLKRTSGSFSIYDSLTDVMADKPAPGYDGVSVKAELAPQNIILELTPEEGQFLRDYLGRTSSTRAANPRAYEAIKNIFEALEKHFPENTGSAQGCEYKDNF